MEATPEDEVSNRTVRIGDIVHFEPGPWVGTLTELAAVVVALSWRPSPSEMVDGIKVEYLRILAGDWPGSHGVMTADGRILEPVPFAEVPTSGHWNFPPPAGSGWAVKAVGDL